MSVAPSPLRTEHPRFAFDFASGKKDSYHPPVEQRRAERDVLSILCLSSTIRMRIMKQIIIKTARGFVYLYGNDYIEVITNA